MKAGSGTFVAFATAPNKTAGCAADENGNGFYTECLLRHIEQPNIKIEDMFKEVRKDVIALTKGAQIPWENTSLKNDFYFWEKYFSIISSKSGPCGLRARILPEASIKTVNGIACTP